MKKTRKISMIPEFLRNRKTYMLTALVFTIIGILSLSFAFFQFSDDTDLTSSNTIMVETMNISDITKTFTVTYEGNNGLIKTGILNAGFSEIYKFKVTNNYNESYPIGINWDAIRSTLNNLNSSYVLYSCTQANYTSATIDNVLSLCTAISPSTNNYLPKTNEMHKLTSTDEIALDANETQYYIAKIVINNTESGKSFTGAIRVKHRETHTLTLNLDGGEISCDTVADMKTGDTVVLPIPTKTGYVFMGWSIGEVDSVINHYTFTMGSMDTTLTASWTANIQNFLYSGNVQIFTVPQTGIYKVEAWGAQGGDSGGYGGYTAGEISLNKDEKLYIYVGGAGSTLCTTNGGSGWNGGGAGIGEASNLCGGGGGGATDIRYFSTEPTSASLVWNSNDGLNNRIMVAGGGGGRYNGIAISGQGGGLTGLSGTVSGGSQSYGYSFGSGGSSSGTSSGGGGGGYYGGFGGGNDGNGGGGSSYISGHNGSISIESINSRIPIGNSIHFSDKYFLNTEMIDGGGYSWRDVRSSLKIMLNPNGGSFPSGSGKTGSGYCRISFSSYTQKDEVTIQNELNNLKKDYSYNYFSSFQKFIAPKNGMYSVEAWGARGGGGGGYGGYTFGELYLEKNEKLYIYTGGAGSTVCTTSGGGGWNGGGGGQGENSSLCGGGGGGATDIRYFSSDPTVENLVWNNAQGLNSRIMVAGGGGGRYNQGSLNGHGGGLTGLSGTVVGGSQYNGASFGLGGTASGGSSGGGGGGYYGGYGGGNDGNGGGGSSYISGHFGSSSIISVNSRIATGESIHFTRKYFLNTKMIDGGGYSWRNVRSVIETMPDPNGGNFTSGTGNNSHGRVKISFLSEITKNSTDMNTEMIELKKYYSYGYNGNYQIFIAPTDGIYNIEAWGARGGGGGGYGGYTFGELYLEKDEKLYIYVAGAGSTVCTTSGGGGWNGGGGGQGESSSLCGGGGGGATDIRYFSSEPPSEYLVWNNAQGLNSRIMVAGGGGGRYNQGSLNGHGGGLTGLSGTVGGGSQYNGASFGLGGTASGGSSGGGGGGYYGGYGGGNDGNGGGGSSYISGHAGSLAIGNIEQTTSPKTLLSGCSSSSTNIECSYHPNLTLRIVASKYFSNTLMIDGGGRAWMTTRDTTNTQMPNPNGGNFTSGTGNTGNGFVRITKE